MMEVLVRQIAGKHLYRTTSEKNVDENRGGPFDGPQNASVSVGLERLCYSQLQCLFTRRFRKARS